MRRLAVSVSLALFFATLLVSSAVQAGVYGGTIESVTSGRLVLKFLSVDKTQSFAIDSDTAVSLDGKPASPSKLKAGMKVSITTLSSGRVLRVKASSDTDTDTTPQKPREPEKTSPRTPSTARPPRNDVKKAGEWPQFRGPNRDNVSAETGLLKEWPQRGPELLWTARGFGEGYSAVSVVDGRVYTMGTQGGNQVAFARELDGGGEVWATPCGRGYDNGAGGGPRSTPTVDGDRVYVLGANGELSCLDAKTGKPQWQKNILQDFGGNNIGWGICESVLIDGEKLICTPGGRGATMVALNKLNGNVLWKTEVPGNPQAGYASPIAVTVGGVKQYVTFTSNAVIGVRASDGRGMWADTSSANGTANCSTPLFYNDQIFSASGYGTGGTLLRLASARGMTASQQVFKTDEMKNHHGGMVIVDGYLYGSNDPGILTCLDLRDGRVKWQNRSVGKGSVTYADGRIYLRSENGPMALVEASPDGYRELGRFDQPDRSGRSAWAHPVIADGKLLLRDQDLMLCYRLKDG